VDCCKETRHLCHSLWFYVRYKPGAGLGKDGQGRVEPVPVVVLPAGKSLDHCMKLKEKKREAKVLEVYTDAGFLCRLEN